MRRYGQWSLAAARRQWVWSPAKGPAGGDGAVLVRPQRPVAGQGMSAACIRGVHACHACMHACGACSVGLGRHELSTRSTAAGLGPGPSLPPQIQAAIGAKNAVAFDLTAACSGFVLALVTASQYVRTGMCRNVLVVGADALSRIVDWRDRGTCILFGDGCGAVLVSAAPEGAGCALLGVDMHSDGAGQKSLNAVYSGSGGKPMQDGDAGSAHASYGNIAMAGQDVFKFAVRSVPAVSARGRVRWAAAGGAMAAAVLLVAGGEMRSLELRGRVASKVKRLHGQPLPCSNAHP